MTWPARAYRAGAYAARGLLAVASVGSPRLRLGIAGRVETAAAFLAWGRMHRDPRRPLVLFHAPSAGELRQAEPVVRRIQRRHPEWQLVVTCTSPSGIPVAESFAADIVGYLPFDLPSEVERFLEAVAPSAIVVCKLDLWPGLALAAAARGIPVGLIAATVRARSTRLRWPARVILRPGYASLAVAAAVSPQDALRLALLGVRPERISVLGDPRYDAVGERLARASAPPTRGATTLVAGSTWPPDERVLLAAFAQVRAVLPAARLVLVPHEPDARSLGRIATLAAARGLPAPLSHRAAGATHPLVVVEEVGSLAFHYGAGVIGYVGGGFGRSGVHSVLEPAAWGLPVIVGPLAGDNPDVERLAQAGGLERLPRREASDALARCWVHWLRVPVDRDSAGRAAEKAILAARGAAERSAVLVEELVQGRRETADPGPVPR